MTAVLALVLGLAGVAFVVSSLTAAPRSTPTPETLKRLADHTGLHGVDGGLRGFIGSYSVRVYPNDHELWWIETELRFTMPARCVFQLGEVDAVHRADLRWLFATEEVQTLVRGIEERHGRLRVGDRVSLGVSSEGVPEGARLAVQLASGLRTRRFSGVAEALRLLGHDPALAPYADRIEGIVDGVSVVIDLPTVDGDRWRLRIQADWLDPLPPETRLARRVEGRGASVSLGDPILDTALHVHTTDPAGLRLRIGTDAARGPLLDLLCGGTVASADANGLTAAFDDGALDVPARLQTVLDVVHTVGRP